MPLYEYQCDACGHRFETIQKFADPPLEACPKCGGAVRKLQSAPAFQFKGTGWYITDYPKKDGAKPGAGSGEGKGESGDAVKPAEKSNKADKSDAAASTPAAAPAAAAAKPKDAKD